NLERHYNPYTARFLSEDPIGFRAGDTNLFRYVKNNPINFKDSDGLKRDDPTRGASTPEERQQKSCVNKALINFKTCLAGLFFATSNTASICYGACAFTGPGAVGCYNVVRNTFTAISLIGGSACSANLDNELNKCLGVNNDQ